MKKTKLTLLLVILLLSGSTVSSQTSNWRQYSSSMVGISIGYPSDWRSKEDGDSRVSNVWFSSPGVFEYDMMIRTIVRICSQPKGHALNYSTHRQSCPRIKNNSLKVISEQVIKLDGLDAKKTISKTNFARMTYISFQLLTKNREIFISGRFPQRYNFEKYIPIFEQMVGTLQILDNTNVLTFRNEKYRLSLEYPKTWRSCPVDFFNLGKEYILKLVPDSGSGCLGGDFISIRAQPDSQNLSELPDLQKLLNSENYVPISPSAELGEISTISGERETNRYLYRQRYFYTKKDNKFTLLTLSEMYDRQKMKPKRDATGILKTIRKY